MSKKNIRVENPSLSKTFFGAIDTSMFFTYAVAQFFTGAIGDMYPKRKVLTISFALQGTLFCLVGIGGFNNMFYLWYFCPIFAIIGFI
jgi:sugar phosphate permease